MPNWVTSELKVTGPKEELARFKREAQYKDEPLSFRGIYPIPTELEGVGNKILTQEEYDKQQAAEKVDDWGLGVTQEIRDSLIERFGTHSWYKWALSHWGTKWGVCESDIHEVLEGVLSYSFQTAWSPAEEGWVHISSLFPTLLFQTFIEEESNEFNGRQDFQDGEMLMEELHSNVIRSDVLDVLEEISELSQEDAIRDFRIYMDEYDYCEPIIEAITARVAGEEVSAPVDELKHLRLYEE